MQRILLALAATSALVATATTAQAADLPDTFVEPVATFVAPVTWTGGYVGLYGGYAFNNDDSDVILFDTNLDGVFGDTVGAGSGVNAFSPGFCSGTANGATPAFGCDDDEGGFTASARVGYDYQAGSFVVGALAELSYLDLDEATTAFSTTPTFYTIERELDYTVAARARAGFATEQLLAYVTGGGVFGDIDYEFDTGNTVNTFVLDESDDSDFGFQVGGGIEFKVTEGISVGAEYLYTRFEDQDVTVRAAGGNNVFVAANPLGTDFTLADDEFDYHEVKAGLNLRF